MPVAAWCSACQKYVWVAPDGRCQHGHPSESLSAYHDAPAVPAERRRLSTSARLAFVVVGACLLLGCALGSVGLVMWGLRSARTQAAAPRILSRQATGPRDPIEALDFGAPSTTKAPRKDRAWYDAYIAREYPDYLVEEARYEADQRLLNTFAANYLLRSKRDRRFRVAVTLWQLPPASKSGYSVNAGGTYVDLVEHDVTTTDGVFSKSGGERLGVPVQAALIDEYVRSMSATDAVVSFCVPDGRFAYFSEDAGEGVLEQIVEYGDRREHISDGVATIGGTPQRPRIVIELLDPYRDL